MARLLHAADWQIDMKMGHASKKAEFVRQKRFETAGRIVELAKAGIADLVPGTGRHRRGPWYDLGLWTGGSRQRCRLSRSSGRRNSRG
ncbi:MAG: hypothetical protein PHT97_04085 [Methanoculleus sp.]|uniref:hypothetical protein n=1 Tax=unclassified Methanoculleus TaxID=2619537 RepID=UPI0025E78483|nr:MULTISPECIES: hypothetical protein [unclassified Methanoculleus]MCK9316929.1 hypothetical protein [Methanoculleus sp.]MDD2253291.1 hypothetical protein [Methanoculleus sp.]MDD2788226.1 hypothetical protein [Methanoculleus sp.]MDD3215131.1 hypothetical protein [Methanoculleus sp.]MDD4470320.1 hypothetical protein [Methanoculleus sp.]